MNDNIYFMALGGGQRVGASCYYIKLGLSNLILDCGLGIDQNILFEPNLYCLLTSPFIQSLSQLNQVYISHAHLDHVGYLPKLLKETPNTPVFMTEMTAFLSEYQIYDKNFINPYRKHTKERERIATQYLLENKVVYVSYMQTIDMQQYKVTFFPAGHIPGAMMMLFEYKNRKILYTGDFSVSATPLTDGFSLPDGIEIDTVIMCGLYAKRPSVKRYSDGLRRLVEQVIHLLQNGRNVYCRVQQLSKGVEFLKVLNERNKEENLNYNIFIEEEVFRIVKKMEQLSIPIITENNYLLGTCKEKQMHVIIGSKKIDLFPEYEKVKVDFTLHVNFDEMIQFIKRINPKKAVIVHCSEQDKDSGDTIEQRLMTDAQSRTQFIFAEEEERYII